MSQKPICERSLIMMDKVCPEKGSPIRSIMDVIIYDPPPKVIGHIDRKCPDDILEVAIMLLFKASVVIFYRQVLEQRGIDPDTSEDNILIMAENMHEVTVERLRNVVRSHYGSVGDNASIDMVQGCIWLDKTAVDRRLELVPEILPSSGSNIQ